MFGLPSKPINEQIQVTGPRFPTKQALTLISTSISGLLLNVIRSHAAVTSPLAPSAAQLEVLRAAKAPERNTAANKDDEEEERRELAPAVFELGQGLGRRRARRDGQVVEGLHARRGRLRALGLGRHRRGGRLGRGRRDGCRSSGRGRGSNAVMLRRRDDVVL